MAAARTGPTPGRVSSCSTVAVLRLTCALGAPFVGRDVVLGVAGGAPTGRTVLPRGGGRPMAGPPPPHNRPRGTALGSHVEPDGVRAVGDATGGLQRVGDARPGRQRDE